jgi:protein ImuB
MCVWCPLWPIQRLRSEPPALSRSLETTSRNRVRAVCVAGGESSSPPLTHDSLGARGLDPSHTSETQLETDGRGVHPTDSERAVSRPLILFAEVRRGLYVTTCSPEAARSGVHPGMPLSEARSLVPRSLSSLSPSSASPSSASPSSASPSSSSRSSFKTDRFSPQPNRPVAAPVFQRADPAADRAALQQLALDCQQYSPLVGLDDAPEPESLWLDISGNELLFGGERALAGVVRADFARRGIQVRVAIADTWGAAWAVAHFGEAVVSVIPSGDESQSLGSLPVAALRLPDSVIESLRTLDVSTIGRLLPLPRESLPSRFGKELVRRLDQALGLAPEVLTAERLVEPLRVEWLFEEPISDRQTVEHVITVLLDRLLEQLSERRASLREVRCVWLGTTTEPISLRLLRPTTDRRHLLELLRLQCERRVFAAGVTGVQMEIVEMGLPPVRQKTLFEDDSDADERHQHALAELVDRLSSRLGRCAVLRPRLCADPQPEYSCNGVPWLDAPASHAVDTAIARSQLRCRPLRLLRVPQPLIVEPSRLSGLPTRANHSPVVRLSGPERIETGWWRGPDAKRDYYRLDLANGSALWAFVDRDTGGWFLHGVFV